MNSVKHDDAERLRIALESAERRAQSRRRQFLMLSVVWIAGLIGGAAYVNSQMSRIETAVEQLESGVTSSLGIIASSMTSISEQTFAARTSLQLRSELDQAIVSDPALFAFELAKAETAQFPLTAEDQRALEKARSAAAGDNSARGLYMRGTNYLKSDDYDGAVAALQQAVEKDPMLQPAQMALGRALSYAWRIPQADETLNRAILLNPNDTAAFVERCWVRLALNRLDEALQDCNRAIQLPGDEWRGYQGRAFVYYQKNDDLKAEQDWRTAAATRYNPASPIENITLIYLRQAKWEKALDNTRVVNILRPDSGSNGAWNWLFTSIAAEKMGDSERANKARMAWNARKSEDDVKTLSLLLPDGLKPYLSKN